MRLIDADKAKLKVFDYTIFRLRLGTPLDVVNFLDNQLTIDAVPVVRCGNCAYVEACKSIGAYLGRNGFCSRGLKEGADNE